MIVSGLAGPDGADIADLEELDRLAEQGASCFWYDVELSALSMLDAATSSAVEWKYDIVGKSVNRFRSAAIHEMNVGGVTQELGLVTFPLASDVPTAVEVVLCKLILQGLDRAAIENKEIWFRSGPIAEPVVALVRAAYNCGLETFFHRNSVSSVEAFKADDEGSRVLRHLQYSYDNYAKKYGFLELFRALEMNFLDNLLKYVSKNFMKNTESTLKTALERLNAENKLAYNVIKEVGCEGLAEEIADTVNKARSLGNTFATALFEAFEKRGDKLTEKTWRGACYIYSIRCAIAHAGHTNIVYEDYVDGDVLLAQVYGYFEDILLNIAGIRTTKA